MKRSIWFVVALVSAAVTFGALAQAEDEKPKPKHTIKEVMAKAMKGKDALNTKVKNGKASDKEKLELLDMYISMVESEAPKGDKASWQMFAGRAALAAAKVAVGREDGIKELKAATNCAKCHKAHKPPAKK